jgi:hypothetical protein
MQMRRLVERRLTTKQIIPFLSKYGQEVLARQTKTSSILKKIEALLKNLYALNISIMKFQQKSTDARADTYKIKIT